MGILLIIASVILIAALIAFVLGEDGLRTFFEAFEDDDD